MNIRETIEQIAGDFGTQCSFVVSKGDTTNVYIEQDVYKNYKGNEWPYMFFPSLGDEPIYFDAEQIVQIIITRNGVCIHISIP